MMKKNEGKIPFYNPFHLLLYFPFFPPTYTYTYPPIHTHKTSNNKQLVANMCIHISVYTFKNIWNINSKRRQTKFLGVGEMNRKDKVFFCDSNETGIMNQQKMGGC